MVKLLKRCENLTLNLYSLFAHIFFFHAHRTYTHIAVSAWCFSVSSWCDVFFGHHFCTLYLCRCCCCCCCCYCYLAHSSTVDFVYCGDICVRQRFTASRIAGVFLICWVPFFSCNILDAMCTIFGAQCSPGVTAFILTTWLGYMNR